MTHCNLFKATTPISIQFNDKILSIHSYIGSFVFSHPLLSICCFANHFPKHFLFRDQRENTHIHTFTHLSTHTHFYVTISKNVTAHRTEMKKFFYFFRSFQIFNYVARRFFFSRFFAYNFNGCLRASGVADRNTMHNMYILYFRKK